MKSINIIIILVIIIIISSGCLSNSNDVINANKDLKDTNVDFYIELITEDIALSSKEILIKINIKNNEENSIQIQETLYYSSIIDANGTQYDVVYGNITIDPKEIIIKSGDTYSTSIDLKGRGYKNNDYGNLKWIDTGKYKCQVQAFNIESNWLEFEITS